MKTTLLIPSIGLENHLLPRPLKILFAAQTGNHAWKVDIECADEPATYPTAWLCLKPGEEIPMVELWNRISCNDANNEMLFSNCFKSCA
jgi:hypothetical protein